MNKMQSYVVKYASYLNHVGYGKSAQEMLPVCIKEFFTYHAVKELENITSKEIRVFYEYLQERPCKQKAGSLSESTIYRYVYALKLFFNWLEISGQITENPISAMKFKMPEKKEREPLSQSETKQLFSSCANAKETALLHLFYSCRLRRSEGEALNASDIHFKAGLLYVREGKNSRRRVIPITEKVSTELENYYLAERKSEGETAFMINAKGRRMKGVNCNKIVKKIIKKAGLEKETSLHHLRHSIATHLLESGLKIEYIKDFLGHKQLESTQGYTKVNLKKYEL